MRFWLLKTALTLFTGVSVQEDNFENRIVLLDGFLPKKNCPGPKIKIVLLDGCLPGRIYLYTLYSISYTVIQYNPYDIGDICLSVSDYNDFD